MKQLLIAAVLGVSFIFPKTTVAEACISAHTEYDSYEDLVGGYCDRNDHYIYGLITIESWNITLPAYAKGNVVWYSPDLMEATAQAQGIDLSQYVDGVALMSCQDFGQVVWIKRPGYDWEGPFIVVDCAKRQHMFAAIYYNGEIAEVGFKTAERWGMVHIENGERIVSSYVALDVEIYKGSAPPQGGDSVDYRNWWLDQVQFTSGKSLGELYQAHEN